MIARIAITTAVVFVVAASRFFCGPDAISQLVIGVAAVVMCFVPLFVLSRRQFIKSAAGSVQTLVCVLVAMIALLSVFSMLMYCRTVSLWQNLNNCRSTSSVESAPALAEEQRF